MRPLRALPPFATLAVAVAMAPLLGCGPREPAETAAKTREIPLEDVSPPPDANLSTAGDKQGRVRRESFAGVLPGNFPRDVPVYEPSTLIDFGSAAGGRGYVEMQTPQAPAVARARYQDQLRARGFGPSADGVTYFQGDRVLRVTYQDARPGTRIRVEYPAG